MFSSTNSYDMTPLSEKYPWVWRRGRDWRRLLRRIRSSCHGKLFYSQNWDHTRKLSFEAGLDAVGMNAYFELSPELRPSPARLRRAWARTRRKLEAAWPRPAPGRIFTEVGYPSVDGAAKSPWNYEQPGRANAKLQKDCLEAFFRAWAGSPAIHGAIIYLWSEQEDAAGTHYSIRAKPAEATVRKWFRAGFPQGANP